LFCSEPFLSIEKNAVDALVGLRCGSFDQSNEFELMGVVFMKRACSCVLFANQTVGIFCFYLHRNINVAETSLSNEMQIKS